MNHPQDPPAGLPDPPVELRRRLGWRAIVVFFGPGAIIASLGIGSGETVLASRIGAVFGYAALWLVVVGVLIKAAVVYASNRYIVLTGEHPMQGMARLLPGPRGWLPLVVGILAIVSFPSVASGLATGIGSYLHITFGGPALAWGLGLLVLGAGLAALGGYTALERAQIAIVALMVLLVVIAVFVSNPEWGAIAAGLIPQPLEYAGFVAREYPEIAERAIWVEAVVFIGGIGGGMYDYIGYTGLLREKRWGALAHPTADGGTAAVLADDEDTRRRGKAWVRAPLGDVTLSFVTIAVITFAFIINGASILGRQEVAPAGEDVLTHQAAMLGIISPIFLYFYVVAVVMVFFGTMYALWEVYTRTTYESLQPLSARIRGVGLSGMRVWVFGYILVASVAMTLTGGDLVALISWANILGGSIAIGIYGLGLVRLDRLVLPPGLRLHRAARTATAVGSVALSVAGVVALLQNLGIL
ncbi:MAG TPA: Nramp family divalent metal transporter [Pseudonocardia sp.]|nr:Nramp family divalent metal transporter [Pseudonocardia sp.]